MKKILLISIIIYSGLTAQYLQLTLDECIKLGLGNSKELKISNSRIENAEAMSDEITASTLPKLSLSAGYIRLSDVHPFKITLPILPKPVTIQETILDNYNLRATIEQPIFTGFKLSSLKTAAELNSKAEAIEFDRETIKKIDEINQVFWKFYSAQQITILLEKSFITLKAHLRNTESFLNNGLVTKNDYLKLEVEVASAELNLIDVQNREQLTQSIFNKTLGLPIAEKTNLIIEQLESDSFNAEYKSLLKEALKERQEIKVTKLQIKALEKKENAAFADWYPQLFAFGNFYYNNPNQRFMPLDDKFNNSWDIGLSLKWEVWNWGGTSAKVEQAKQSYFQAQTAYELLKENIELDVYNNYLTVQSAEKRIELSKTQVRASEENYRITKEKYNQQLATSTDLIDAETALLNARTGLITSKVSYKINLSSLNKSLGRQND